MRKLNRTKAKIKPVCFITSGSDPIFRLVQQQQQHKRWPLPGDPVQNHHADISRWPESPSKLDKRQPLQTSGRLQGTLASALDSHALRSHQSRNLHTYLWPESSGIRQRTSTRRMRRLPMKMEECALTRVLWFQMTPGSISRSRMRMDTTWTLRLFPRTRWHWIVLNSSGNSDNSPEQRKWIEVLIFHTMSLKSSTAQAAAAEEQTLIKGV